MPGFEGPPGKPEQGVVTCPVCGGTGKKDGKSCARCSGSGQVRTS